MNKKVKELKNHNCYNCKYFSFYIEELYMEIFHYNCLLLHIDCEKIIFCNKKKYKNISTTRG